MPKAMTGGLGASSRSPLSFVALVVALFATAVIAAPAGASDPPDCPNATIRAQQGSEYLPDCRAYEMMTPEYTQGGNRIYINSLTADGSRGTLATAGIFAGTEGMVGQGGSYMVRRTETGWKTTSLNPPASMFWRFAGGVSDTSPDGLRGIWSVAPRSKENSNFLTFSLREDDGVGNGTWFAGTPELVDDGASLLGASADGRTLVVGLTRERLMSNSGTLDTRRTPNTQSMYRIARGLDGSFRIDQIGYRDGATLFPDCGVSLGFGHSPSTTTQGAISPGATRIIFGLTGITPCRTAEAQRVYAWDSKKGVIELSASKCTGAECGDPQVTYFEGGSRDGRRAYFTTAQKLVNGDGAADATVAKRINLYEYDFDRVGNELRPITVSADAAGAGVVRLVRLSENGSRAYFVANGRPLAGENASGKSPLPNRNNLYVYHRDANDAEGTITFVATLVSGSGDNSMWSQDQARNIQAYPADGRYLMFQSSEDVTEDKLPGDNKRDFYWYDSVTEQIKRVWSQDAVHNGTDRVGAPSIPNRSWLGGSSPWRWYRGRTMTDDGRYVYFDTSERFDSRDINDYTDVYQWDSSTGDLSLISGGDALGDASVGAMTPDGSTVTFITDQQLISDHTSTAFTAYAARVDGGFPPSRVPAPPSCEGDGCQGSVSLAPKGPVIGSLSFAGGNEGLPQVRATVAVRRLKAAKGSIARLRVRVPGAGRISVRGSAVRATKASASRAGTYSVKVALSAKGKRKLKQKEKLKVGVRVVYRSASGEAASKRLSVTFKQPKARKSSSTSSAKAGR